MPRYLRIALIIFIPLALVFLSLSHEAPDSRQSERPTSFSFAPKGTRGLYATFKELRTDTERWSKPLSDLLEHHEVSTLVVFSPEVPLSGRDRIALAYWIESGGQLVFISDGDWTVRPSPEAGDVPDLLDSYDIPTNKSMVYTLGEGHVVVVSSDIDLSNHALETDPSSAVSVIQTVLKQLGPIYFDEYHLGYGHEGSFFNLLARCLEQPWGKCLLILAIAGLFLLLHKRLPITRKQPPIPAQDPSEKGAFHELIDARGGLFKAADATELCKQSIQTYKKI